MKLPPLARPPAQAAAQARRAAFDELHHEHARGIYNLALRLLRHHQDAEDVTQEVLLKLFCQLAQDELANPRAWLYRVTFNACYDQLSHAARRRSLACEGDPESMTAPGDPYEQAELASLVEATLDRLPLVQRTALLLRELHGLHPAEVASVLGTETPSAEVTLSRARRTFRARYRELTGEKPAATVGVGALALVVLPASLHLSALQGALAAALGSGAAGVGSGACAGSGLGASSGAGAAGSGAVTVGGGGSGIASQAGVGLLSKVGGALSTKVAVAVAKCHAGGRRRIPSLAQPPSPGPPAKCRTWRLRARARFAEAAELDQAPPRSHGPGRGFTHKATGECLGPADARLCTACRCPTNAFSQRHPLTTRHGRCRFALTDVGAEPLADDDFLRHGKPLAWPHAVPHCEPQPFGHAELRPHGTDKLPPGPPACRPARPPWRLKGGCAVDLIWLTAGELQLRCRR